MPFCLPVCQDGLCLEDLSQDELREDVFGGGRRVSWDGVLCFHSIDLWCDYSFMHICLVEFGPPLFSFPSNFRGSSRSECGQQA